MKRREFSRRATLLAASIILPVAHLQAKTYLTIEQAKKVLWGDTAMKAVMVNLTKQQMISIYSASKVRVRNPKLQAWKTNGDGWFIVDQVIGKHENIDMAYALSSEGKVLGLEVLTYRESYGDEVMHPKWRAQFNGKNHTEHLKLDRQIKNISGATLSCRHVTDGVNRLNHTWEQVLQFL